MKNFVLILLLLAHAAAAQTYDIIIRNGTVYDGSGNAPVKTDIGIRKDTIAFVGDLSGKKAGRIIDATGLAVAPGFINMLSWADGTLLTDGNATSDIMQGITLEVFGEGLSPAPVKRKAGDNRWTTLDGYFKTLLSKGISPNVASFVGATTVRIHEIGYANRPPTAEELTRMKKLVQQAMEQGAMGLGSSLIYAPATYASTEELIELSKVAGSYGGMYITHMRSEGDFILPAINETIRISSEGNLPAEIYHLKINIQRNWPKIDSVINKIDSARNAGIRISANMYPYNASATGLTSRLPTWVQEGGNAEMRKKLLKPDIRKKVLYEMEAGIPYKNSEPENVVLMGFRLDSLNRLYKGKRLSEVARLHGKNADETVVDLVVRDKTRIEALYHLQSEDNVRRIAALPWVSYGSDAGAFTIVPGKNNLPDHPRAFGTFAKILGSYVREENLLSLQEAIRKMTSMPAANLKLKKRGTLANGFFADVVIFDPEKIAAPASFDKPHQYSTGMVYVLVNGTLVLEKGMHTGAKPGRIIRGPGYRQEGR